MSCSDIPACWQNVQFGFVLIFSDFSDGAVSNGASADVIISSETIQTQNFVYIAFGMLYKGNSYIDDQLENYSSKISSGVLQKAVTNSADLLPFAKVFPREFPF